MAANVYHQVRQADPFGPELSPAIWLAPKGPTPKEVFELSETLDDSVNGRTALASRQTSRLTAKKTERSLASRFEGTKRRTMEEAEREHILATLKDTKWVVSGARGAAARLGMNRSTLQFRMKRLGIVRPGR